MGFEIYIITFFIIFILNMIPIFGPPTWMVLLSIVFLYGSEIPSLPVFIMFAIMGSTSGRAMLTLFSKHIVRNRLLGERYVKNIEVLKTRLENNKMKISGIFLLDAITPLPSDQFFVAYGLTGMKLRYALIPFMIGRIFTYTFWVYTATEVSKYLAAKSIGNLGFLSTSFIILEIAIFMLIYLFVKIDWEYFVLTKKFRILR